MEDYSGFLPEGTNPIDLEQGSFMWHVYRMEHRNASEAGAVMGVNPWTTPRQLWEQKRDKKATKPTYAMKRGTQMEPVAAEAIMKAHANEAKDWIVSPVVEKGEYSASFDLIMITHDDKLVAFEIKVPMSPNSQLWEYADDNKIPEYYDWQIVHQNYVWPMDENYLAVYSPEDDRLVEVKRKKITKTSTNKLLKAWDNFYKNPPEAEEIVREDTNFHALVSQYQELKEAARAATEALKEAEAELHAECVDDKNTAGFGLKLTWVERKGSVDYAKVPELKGVDLDPYRKKSTRYIKITEDK